MRHVALKELRVIAHDLAVADAPTIRSFNYAVLDRQRDRIHVEALGRSCDECRACECTCRSQRRAALLHGLRSECIALVGTAHGVSRHDLDLIETDIHFLGSDLRECGEYPLTQLDLAGEDGHRALTVYGDPAIELAVFREAERTRRCARLCAGGRQSERESGDDDTRSPEEDAPAPVHGFAPHRAFAAMIIPFVQ